MMKKHILASIISLGLLGSTAGWAQEATNPSQTSTATTQHSEAKHTRLTAEQLQDISPIYEQLKKDGYTKVASIMQSSRGVKAIVVNDKGEVVRLKKAADSQEFSTWEPRKKDKRGHRHQRKEHAKTPAA